MDIVAPVALEQQPGARPAVVARAVGLRGFGSRRSGEAVLLTTDGPLAGQILGGSADERLQAEATELLTGVRSTRLLDVRVADGAAVVAGLACGGVARVLLERTELVPTGWWQEIVDREPVALVTPLDEGPSRVVRPGDAPQAADRLAAELLARGTGATEVFDDEAQVVEVWWPTPRVVVVGAAELAGAIDRQASILGWDPVLDDGIDPATTAEAVRTLGPADAVIVLSHDPLTDAPALGAALRGRVGFVGALGSRRTQGRRRERLLSEGTSAELIDRIHGPVGLNLGARTPEETALAICAEIVSTRSGRDATSLKDTTGPING